MRYMFASLAVLVAFLAAAQLVTATDLQVAKADQASIDIAALTRTVGNLPVTIADAI